jgi:hypothetical protein
MTEDYVEQARRQAGQDPAALAMGTDDDFVTEGDAPQRSYVDDIIEDVLTLRGIETIYVHTGDEAATVEATARSAAEATGVPLRTRVGRLSQDLLGVEVDARERRES